jgi:hypothetical protein
LPEPAAVNRETGQKGELYGQVFDKDILREEWGYAIPQILGGVEEVRRKGDQGRASRIL